MAEVRVPILDSTGKVASRFWPAQVVNLEANVSLLLDSMVPPYVDAAVASAVASALTTTYVSPTQPVGLSEGDGWLDTSVAV